MKPCEVREMARILIVDDELNMRLVLSAMLKKEGYSVFTASDGIEALEVIKKEPVDVVVTDLKMPRLDGMGLLEKVANNYPALPVIIITAHGTVATAVDALKKGAFDYITKPFEQDDLKNVILKAVKTRSCNQEEVQLNREELSRYGIIGQSPAMQEVFSMIERVAPTTTTILLTGETGTGKELIANAIHAHSPRRNQPMIKINCAAIAENLMESELFGYEKGAFTGAVVSKPGRLELAHKGTLFLDEIGELPREMQVKLLRVLQEQAFERVGGLKTIKVDVRLIAATNRNLLKDVREGRFREDLYYRLNVLPIHLPALRERREDIPALAEFFLEKFNRKLERHVKGFEEGVMDLFFAYNWPGNIREMENLIERLVLITDGDTITVSHLPPEIREYTPPVDLHGQEMLPGQFKEFIKQQTNEVEKQLIAQCLAQCGGNISKAARELGLSRKGLQLKMIKYNLRAK
ncbi:MAG: sigma-54 dependent transcriptional regulator [Syntrophales bacterium]|nr:sigma-54 dependent transcriptional regulator [Syntrophales bacterium]